MPALVPRPLSLTRAATRFAASIVRRYRVLPTYSNWAGRAEICERCPLRVIQYGRSYCGKPFLQQIHRDPARDGCGCPTHAKAKDPREHCPIDRAMNPAIGKGQACTCKWCSMDLSAGSLK